MRTVTLPFYNKMSKEYRSAIDAINNLRAKHPKEFLVFSNEVEQYADCIRILMEEKGNR